MTDCVQFYDFSISRVKDRVLFLMRIPVPHLGCNHSAGQLLLPRTFKEEMKVEQGLTKI